MSRWFAKLASAAALSAQELPPKTIEYRLPSVEGKPAPPGTFSSPSAAAREPTPLGQLAERVLIAPGRVTILHSHAAFTIRQTWWLPSISRSRQCFWISRLRDRSGLSGHGFMPEYMRVDRFQALPRSVPHQLFTSSPPGGKALEPLSKDHRLES